MKNVAIYVRVSSEEQKREGLSMDAQIKKARGFCEFKGWGVYDIYKDEGKSAGTIEKRADFKRLLKDCEENEIEVVLVCKIDRAFRNVKDAITVLEYFKGKNIDFVSCSENIDTTTPMGKAMFVLISTFAELERNMTIDRVRDIRLKKFEDGVFPSKAPYGYKAQKKNGKLVSFILDKRKSEVVRKCFNNALNNVNYKDTCKEFKLFPQQYYNILRNRVYCGYIQFENMEKKGSHQPIVSEGIYNSINK
jgi:site-specific DNA recombinase